MDIYTIYTDGGARGNPGPAAIGVVIKDPEGHEQFISKTIGVSTNNDAEYSAVVSALELLIKNKIKNISEFHFFLDSQLVVRQLSGLYKIKNDNLRSKYLSVKNLESQLNGRIIYHEIPRYKNSKADSLVNAALDNQLPPK